MYSHEKFLSSSRAAFLLLYKCTSNCPLDVVRVGFWLSKLQSHAPEATVFVIGTHAAEVDEEIREEVQEGCFVDQV